MNILKLEVYSDSRDYHLNRSGVRREYHVRGVLPHLSVAGVI